MVGNSREKGREIFARLAEKRLKDRTKMPDREPLCRTFRLFSRIDWCKMRRTDHPNLQLSSTTIRFWSGLPRHVPASAHDWRHVLTFPTRLLLLACPCIRSILAIRLARVADVDTVRKRTASPKPLFVVCNVATPVTLIGTPLSISLGLPSCSLLHRDAPRCKPLGFSPRGS